MVVNAETVTSAGKFVFLFLLIFLSSFKVSIKLFFLILFLLSVLFLLFLVTSCLVMTSGAWLSWMNA